MRPDGRFVFVPPKERRTETTDTKLRWQRAYLWHHLSTVGTPDPETGETRPMDKAEIARLFGVSRPIVSRTVKVVAEVLEFARGLRDEHAGRP